MVDKAEFDAQYEETRLIIEELLEDGSDPDALYAIEHHFSADNFELLEKAAVEAFKLGYEVTDAEELEIETGETLMCCDVISESALNAELIDAQVEQLMKLAEKIGVNYDGWGTYFEDPDAEYDDDEDGDDEGDDESENRVH
ncbi:ribonuclease E inhibitor RraB [Providencia alcalifaciens]|uniref:ribonuclease E inhibitor RraB n=1 Tax=Providencia alcalifaciens TaxID=126385 RepID=UPI002AA0B6D6|nr:ribonuclease E inhibitor RraB [Providencia alcalifaciens]